MSHGTNKQRLIFLSVHILCGLLRRITMPQEISVCLSGGYQESWNEIMFIRNPAAPSYLQYIGSLFKLFKYCHSFDNRTSINGQSSYSFLLTMTDAEKGVYLQQQETNDELNPISSIRSSSSNLSADQRRLHNRFSSFIDRLEILIGTYFTLKPDLYKLPDGLNLIGTTLFSSVDFLPEFRLRNLIRNCFSSFVRHCPSPSMLTAILESLLPFMYNKLKIKWKVISDRQMIKVTNGQIHQTNDDEHQNQDRCEDEVIEEQVS